MTVIGNEHVDNQESMPQSLKSLVVQALGGGLPLQDENGRRVDGRKFGVGVLHQQASEGGTHEIILLIEGERICDINMPIPVYDERVIARVISKASGEVTKALVERSAEYPDTYSVMTNIHVFVRTVSEHAGYVVIRVTDVNGAN
jgi:hypothetical protein